MTVDGEVPEDDAFKNAVAAPMTLALQALGVMDILSHPILLRVSARTKKRQFDELIVAGFTREEALQIVIASSKRSGDNAVV